MKLTFVCVASLALLFVAITAPAQSQTGNAPAQRMAQKLEYLAANAQKQAPDPRPTELLQDEINAYLAAGKVKLPEGVDDLRMELHAQQIIGNAHVDFDRVRAGRNDANPLLSLFSGVHDVRVDAYADGESATASLRIRSVAIDGTNIPRFILQMFVERFVQPKYPNVGLDTRFHLPQRIDQAIVRDGKVVVTQR